MIQQGKIIKQISNDYTVKIDNQLIICKARGKFRNLGVTPLVGDNVLFENNYILEILPRKNELIRPSIANVDQAVIVMSTTIPAFSTDLLDRLLCIIEYNNIKPIIYISKMDLLNQDQINVINKYIEYYKKIGYLVYADLSIKEVFKNKITVFVGQSGAGKSTLLNKLDNNLHLQTGEVSIALGRGKHTTRHVELIKLLDGMIADTPGFSKLSFIDMTDSDIRDNFIEFNEYKELCEYQDCMHKNEDNCEIKRQVKNGNILEERYNNYIKFIENKVIK